MLRTFPLPLGEGQGEGVRPGQLPDFSKGIPLLPHVKHYDWGGRGRNSFLRCFLGSKDMKTPFAEAWYGTHSQGPATVAGSNLTLPEFLKRHPESLGLKPGEPPALPFMVKIIEARRPLSLQVHPNKRQALAGFQRENAQGIPPDSGERCFRDPNAKPEIIMALSPFDLFAGFQSTEKIQADPLCQCILRTIDSRSAEGVRRGVPEAAVRLRASLRGDKRSPHVFSPKHFSEKIFSLRPPHVRSIGRLVFDSLRASANRALREVWLKKLWALYMVPAGDPATLLLPFLSFHRLQKGEFLTILPGTLHSYLGGVGLEVLACSDNVLRLGLTRKKIDPARGVALLNAALRPRLSRFPPTTAPCSLGLPRIIERKKGEGPIVEIRAYGFQWRMTLPAPPVSQRHAIPPVAWIKGKRPLNL